MQANQENQENYEKPQRVFEDPLPFGPLTFQDRIHKRILNSCQCIQLKYPTYNPQQIILASLNSLNYLLFIDQHATKIEDIKTLPMKTSFLIQTPSRAQNTVRCLFGDLKNRLQQIEINLSDQKFTVFNYPNANEEFHDMVQHEIFVKWSLQANLLILLTQTHLYLYHLKEHTYRKESLPSYARNLEILPFTICCNCILFTTRDSIITYNQILFQWDITNFEPRILYARQDKEEIHVISDLKETHVFSRWLCKFGFKLYPQGRANTIQQARPLTVTYDRESGFNIEKQDTSNPKEYENQFISSDRQVCMKFTI